MLADHGGPALQEQMARLADTALIGGERSDATDHCLAGIARLSSEVKDASSYLPTYDQRTYAEVASTSTTTFITKHNSCRQ
jgi:tubulin-specific chaperone C